MTEQIDYSHLSKDQLFDVLEHIDDTQNAENAVAAYSELQNQFAITEQDIDDRYQDDGVTLTILKLLMIPFAGDSSLSKQEMQNKLRRIKLRSSAAA